MKLKTVILGTGSIAAMGVFSIAMAGSPADYFEKIDANADGVVTQAEYVAHKTEGGKYTAAQASESFTKVAGDDGSLTLAEMEAAMEKKASKAKHDCKDKGNSA